MAVIIHNDGDQRFVSDVRLESLVDDGRTTRVIRVRATDAQEMYEVYRGQDRAFSIVTSTLSEGSGTMADLALRINAKNR